jgi:hypothetical protein
MIETEDYPSLCTLGLIYYSHSHIKQSDSAFIIVIRTNKYGIILVYQQNNVNNPPKINQFLQLWIGMQVIFILDHWVDSKTW